MTELKKIFTPEKFEATLLVDEEYDGKRLDQFLQDYLVSFSREQVKSKIKNGDVKIKDRHHPNKPSIKVYHREIITVTTNRGTLEDVYWRGEKIELPSECEIVYRDENIIIMNKPPYMTTHPTGKHLFYCATVYLENLTGQPVHNIHRLDRETSGVLMMCLNPATANECTKYFEMNQVKKCYFFIAHKEKEVSFPFTANERLGEKENFLPRMFAHCFPENSSEGKRAQTHFKLIKEVDGYVLGLAFPKTGRQHQIRSHAAFHGLPLLGDKLYNGDVMVFRRYKDEIPTEEDFDKMQISRHALHAVALHFPYNGGTIARASIPFDLANWMQEKLKVNADEINLEIERIIKDVF